VTGGGLAWFDYLTRGLDRQVDRDVPSRLSEWNIAPGRRDPPYQTAMSCVAASHGLVAAATFPRLTSWVWDLSSPTFGWLPRMDSNHDKQIQNLQCYRYTTRHLSAHTLTAE